ncbi:MAG TPA: sigma-54 dependent transcriptional regulator [Acidobacteriota bacterium]|nr:sigma-54 dependent transcriptional regulator [Acidobacteriota bacterium]
MPSVLIVDDEPNILEVLEIMLKDEGMDVRKSTSGKKALDLLRQEPADIIISDIKMPGFSGVDLLKEAKQLSPETVIIMITAFASTETAIEALQHGACDYLTKPFKMDEVRKILRKALDQKQLKSPTAPTKSDTEAQQGQQLFQALHRSQLVGKSQKILDVYRTIGTVAPGDSTILITGESGTGKELVARAIHEASPRKGGPFVSINCGAFPETLLESELFGYMKGSFTGANSNRKGLIEVANGGSIFLDEIGEMTAAMQVKLLRVLQERTLRPLGGSSEVPVDVRVIAATNRDLQAGIRQGNFREDLYYRIAVINIPVPSLREREEDIELLATHFLRRYAEKAGKEILGLSAEALRCLESYRWPGNVRELENTIERAVALETTEMIQLERLPEGVILNMPPSTPSDSVPLPDGPCDLEEILSEVESSLICRALKQSDGNQTLAAQRLNVTKGSLRHKMQVLQNDPWTFRSGHTGKRSRESEVRDTDPAPEHQE